MYQVIIKGNTLKELKKAAQDVYEELNGGVLEKGPKITVEKDLKEEEVFEEIPVVETKLADPRAEEPTVDMSDLDSEGIPWDSRIHSSGKTKYKKDGTWTIKRGVSDEEANKIKAEYRGVAQQPITVGTISEQKAVDPQPAAVLTPALPTMNSGHTLENFIQNFPLILGGLITEGKITPDYVNQLKAYFNVAQIWMVNDEQKAEMFNSFVSFGIINKVG